MSQAEETAILRGLALLSEQCGEKVSPERAMFMAKKLLPLGAREVCLKLGELLESARRFPTVAEIKAAMGVVEATDEDKARDVAERVFTAIGNGWASSRHKATIAKRDEFVGPIGLEVVRMAGGWERLGESVMDDAATIHKAQWREYAAVVIRKERSGTLDQAPQFTALPEVEAEVKALEAKWAVGKVGEK